jgi:uncharacterized circularly permuted ATP-grasp superfamily protein
MKEGSLVVNSSQGGGTKDTWVLQDASSDSADGKLEASSIDEEAAC